jgi:biopolymer transport protein ExbD
MQFREKKPRKALINITSLIDVLFLLLIFVMVSSTFMEQPGIKLELPQAQTAVVTKQEFTLFMDKKGNVFLNDKPVTMEALEPKLKEVLSRMKDGSLTLKADRDVTHGLVVKVMDIVKKSGVKKLVIGTKLK